MGYPTSRGARFGFVEITLVDLGLHSRLFVQADNVELDKSVLNVEIVVDIFAQLIRHSLVFRLCVKLFHLLSCK